MKKYSEYMNEITPDELYEGLLGYGMFAEKLPPIFTSKAFFDFCKSGNVSFEDKPSQYVYYENIRNVNIPRPLGIPTPMSYQKLCWNLKENWSKLQNYFEKTTSNQNHKVSRIHLRKMYDKKHLFEMNYSNWRIDPNPDEDLLIDKYYMVTADISKCFPSIYTHSIPWALVGKSQAKQQRNKKLWFNKIDHYLQNTKHGETHGLIIGPHASNIISEIVLCKIDNNLVEKGWSYVRNIDDYTCYVTSEEKAREFLIDLQMELREFDLLINHKKTEIKELPLAAVEHWVRKINTIDVVTNYGKVDYKNCRAYLDFAIEMAKKEGDNSSILKYAIKVLSKQKLTDNAKKYMEKTVFHLCLIYPYLVSLLDEYVFSVCETNESDIKSISNKLYEMGMSCRIFEASSYALYFSIKYKFTLDKVDALNIQKSKDCILMLLGYKYFVFYDNKEAMTDLENHAVLLAGDEEDLNQNWLFVYEILSQNSLKLTDDWKLLKDAGISFVRDDFHNGLV